MMRKENIDNFAIPNRLNTGMHFSAFYNSFPKVGLADDMKRAINAIHEARQNDKSVILGIGGHVIKTCLGKVISDLIESKIITSVAMNGAAMIHDLEFAYYGCTSEDVDSAIEDGTYAFDMQIKNLSFMMNDALIRAHERTPYGSRLSLGSVMQQLALKGPHKNFSVLANATGYAPISIHVSFGTDINQMHPGFPSDLWGEATYADFDKFCGFVNEIEGGVYINMGSAVMLPEVFLKAVARGRAHRQPIKNFTTIAMDFMKQYRPMRNVVERPTENGIYLVGAHEIMLPLMAWQLKQMKVS